MSFPKPMRGVLEYTWLKMSGVEFISVLDENAPKTPKVCLNGWRRLGSDRVHAKTNSILVVTCLSLLALPTRHLPCLCLPRPFVFPYLPSPLSTFRLFVPLVWLPDLVGAKADCIHLGPNELEALTKMSCLERLSLSGLTKLTDATLRGVSGVITRKGQGSYICA